MSTAHRTRPTPFRAQTYGKAQPPKALISRPDRKGERQEGGEVEISRVNYVTDNPHVREALGALPLEQHLLDESLRILDLTRCRHCTVRKLAKDAALVNGELKTTHGRVANCD